MKRTVELRIEVADDDGYAEALAAIYSAVKPHGIVQEFRYTRASSAISQQVEKLVPGLHLKQYSGSVHEDPA